MVEKRKIFTNAERCAVVRADARAESGAVWLADIDAASGAALAGRPVYRWCGAYLPLAPAERPIHLVYRSLRWSYSNRWLTVSYKQVAPLGLKRRADAHAEIRAEWFAETRAVVRAEHRADCCVAIVQTPVQNLVQILVQMFVQYDLQKSVQSSVQKPVQIGLKEKWQRCRNGLQK